MKLGPTSDRTVAARRFGLELRRALAARKISTRAFAVRSGIGRTRLVNWLGGTASPTVEAAEQVADLLMWPRLVDLARMGRARSCDSCGKEFIVESPGPQRFCSADCKRFHSKVAAAKRDLSRAVLERRVRRLDTAIAEMCAACEPSGICRTPDCPLQLAGVSPLAVAKASVA